MITLCTKKAKYYVGGSKVKKMYLGANNVYSAGNWVTYIVDADTSYNEEIEEGVSVLSPTSFTPSKNNWTFVGWREDTVASGDVLSSKAMQSDSIILYAVFEQIVTCEFISYCNTQTVNGVRYYNNGNINDASAVVPTGATYEDWTWRGWSEANATTANTSVAYENGTIINGMIDSAIYYGLYDKSVTAKFYSGYNTTLYPDTTATLTTGSGTAYYNAYGTLQSASITVPTGASVSDWTWRGWSNWWDTTANGTAIYENGDTVVIHPDNDGVPFFGLYSKSVTLSYDGNGATSGSTASQTGTAYHNSAGNYSNPNFTLAENGFTRSGDHIIYAFSGWDLGAVGANITLDTSKTAYAQWEVIATMHTVNFLDSSLWTKVANVDNAVTPFKVNSDCVEVCVQDDETMTDYANASYQATFKTQGCNKLRVKVKSDSGERNAGGSTVYVNNVAQGVPESTTYLYFDISGDTYTIRLGVSNASSAFGVTLFLYEIYAYYE